MKDLGWRKMHLERLRYLYGEEYRHWNDKCHDDRAVYCRLYENIEAGLRSLPLEPNNWIKTAVNAKVKADYKRMDQIKAVFARREEKAAREVAQA